MNTLSHWVDLLSDTTRTIECAEMRLLSSTDHAPPVFTGPGYIRIPSTGAITFTMYAASEDCENAARSLANLHKNPHDHEAQFRLQALDYQGIEWAGGWTCPELKGLPRVGYPLTGTLLGLSTQDTGPSVSPTSSVELAFVPSLWVPLDEAMITVSTVGEDEIERRIGGGKQSIQVLNTEITFGRTPSDRILWLTAATSTELSHPYAERWLSEPLRVLLGQLIYPRITARNFGDGRAMVRIAPVPKCGRQPTDVSLLGEDVLGSAEEFWDLYKRLLTITATAKNADGRPNFDVVHPVTRYYEEIVQATSGSLWVLCMTLSGAVEGLVRLLESSANPKIDNALKERAKRGAITREHQLTWTKVRHVVMHGKLIPPWPEQETGQQIQLLMDLVRLLTHELLKANVEKSSLE